MEAILDTNFIISCILKRIDFIGELEGMGFRVKLPREVLQEMKDLKMEGKTGRKERVAIDLAFEIFEKTKMKKMTLGGKNVDEGLIAKGREGAYIATLDRGIKREVPNRVIISSSKSGLMVERD